MNEELNKALNNLGKEYIKSLTNELIKADKVATGSLLNSLSYEVVETVNGLVLEISSNTYLDNVDQGRRPGKKPPFKSIESWIKTKGIQIPNKSLKQMTYMISTSIGRKGIKPTNVKQKAIDDILNNKAYILQNAAIEDINQILNEILK